jgi:hypothetical protein
MDKHKAANAYKIQKFDAKRRGISFCFTFEDWVNWWEEQLGYDWQKKRGRLRHLYCMARFNDKGPYARGNVKCITNAENCGEVHGDRNGNAVITNKIARKIYLARGTVKEIAHRFNIRIGVVRTIKNRQQWKAVTEGLGAARKDYRNRAKLNVEQVKEIYQMRGSFRKIAKLFNVGSVAIFNIKKGVAWRHITSQINSPPV